MVKKGFEFVSAAAKRDFRALPVDEQTAFLSDFDSLQQGLSPSSSITYLVGSVGKGAFELRRNGSPAHRVVCCLKYLDTLFVLHAFAKSTNGVDTKNIATASARYKELMGRVRDRG
nr:type II toxin-antitoxin system RelE/ParE family toxin [Luteibacter rhizovicinus]